MVARECGARNAECGNYSHAEPRSRREIQLGKWKYLAAKWDVAAFMKMRMMPFFVCFVPFVTIIDHQGF